jgi:hypothetical protein
VNTGHRLNHRNQGFLSVNFLCFSSRIGPQWSPN